MSQDLLEVQAEGTRGRREGEVRSEGRGPGYEISQENLDSPLCGQFSPPDSRTHLLIACEYGYRLGHPTNTCRTLTEHLD